MNSIFFSHWPVVAEIAVTAWAGLLVIMLMRHPRRPRWSEIELVDQMAVVLMIAASAFVAMDAGTRLIGGGLSSGAAAGALVATAAVAVLSACVLFRIPERLRRAEAGHSPFGSLSQRPAPRRRARRPT